jgi:dihydroxyacetone kinase DhaKLM complex PTS-EIIA-like component DhaM
MLRGCHWDARRIALAMDMSEADLRAEFADELEHGGDRVRAEMIALVYGAALADVKGAGKIYLREARRRAHGE